MNDICIIYCEKCQYDLTGIGPAGRCPECGHAFDKTSGRGVLSGPTPGDEGRRVSLIARWTLLVGILVIIAACGGFFAILSSSADPLIIAAAIAAVLIGIALVRHILEKPKAR